MTGCAMMGPAREEVPESTEKGMDAGGAHPMDGRPGEGGGE